MYSDIPLPFTPANKQELRQALNVYSKHKQTAIQTYGNIDTWITTNVTDMSYLFVGLDAQYTFNNRDDIISNWDTSNVTDMSGLFTATSRFNQPLYWDTSKVENMSLLFSQCEEFNQYLHWDTSNVKTMKQMFFYCLKLNSPIYFSDTSNVENMDYMFKFSKPFKQDMSYLNVNRVVNFNPHEMFKMGANYFRQEHWPFKCHFRTRKDYLMFIEGTQSDTPGKYNTHQEKYLFAPEIIREIATYIY
jgi:hypothetical protein